MGNLVGLVSAVLQPLPSTRATPSDGHRRAGSSCCGSRCGGSGPRVAPTRQARRPARSPPTFRSGPPAAVLLTVSTQVPGTGPTPIPAPTVRVAVWSQPHSRAGDVSPVTKQGRGPRPLPLGVHLGDCFDSVSAAVSFLRSVAEAASQAPCASQLHTTTSAGPCHTGATASVPVIVRRPHLAGPAVQALLVQEAGPLLARGACTRAVLQACEPFPGALLHVLVAAPGSFMSPRRRGSLGRASSLAGPVSPQFPLGLYVGLLAAQAKAAATDAAPPAGAECGAPSGRDDNAAATDASESASEAEAEDALDPACGRCSGSDADVEGEAAGAVWF
jgi:hypothetical protein